MIGINAQINPTVTGGSETNFLSLLKALKHAPDAKISLLTFKKFIAPLLEEVPHAKAIHWPHGQTALPGTRGQILRRIMGAENFERALSSYRKRRYGIVSGGKATIDKSLTSSGIKAVHFPYANLFETSLPFIYEPWDLQHLHLPEFFEKHERQRRERMYRYGCQNARIIITATKWTKDDIVKQYGIDPRKIVVMRRSSLLARHHISDEMARYGLAWEGLPADFIFYPAMMFEHKNHVRLLRAIRILKDEGMTLNVVFSGRPVDRITSMVQRCINELELTDNVKYLGEVNNRMLTALYRGAKLLVYPSMFEGLGLPILEAFNHDLPVLAARTSCIPEVAGDAALLFDEKSPEDIATAIATAINSPRLLADLTQRGRKRLAEFCWSKNLPILLACYKELLGASLNEEERHLLAASRA